MSTWLKLVWSHPTLFLATFLAGAIAALVYSYAPLHSSKNWKIDYLEGRVDSQNEQINQLEAELVQSRSQTKGQPQPGELVALRSQLEQAQSEVERINKHARQSETTVQRLRRSLAKANAKSAPPAAPSPSASAPTQAPKSEDAGKSAEPEQAAGDRKSEAADENSAADPEE